MPANPSDYALIIGINDYPRFNFPLKGARRDAELFAEWVNDQETGGGVPESQTAVLLSKMPEGDIARPVHEEIDTKLENLINMALKNRSTIAPRRFYFYFSGHGLGLTPDDAGLCLPFWSNSSSAAAALKLSGYRNYLLKWGLFTEVFFFLDCCRVSLIAGGGHDPMLTLAAPRPGAENSNYLTAFASTYTNAAFEAELKSGETPAEIRGFFTSGLLEGLKGAAARPEGGVPLFRLLSYLDGRVGQIAASAGKLQKAVYYPSFTISEMEAIILGSALPTAPHFNQILEAHNSKSLDDGTESFVPAYPFVVLGPEPPQDVFITVFDEAFQKIYEDFNEINLSLPQGKYLLRFQLPDQMKELEMNHGPSGTHIVHPDLPVFSSAPFTQLSTTPPYYAEQAIHWSKNLTDQSESQAISGIFIFARFLNDQKSKALDFFNGLTLWNQNLELIHDFGSNTVQENRQTGWYAFSKNCPGGQYYLSYRNGPERYIPVFCFSGWQTQIFVMLNEQGPVWSTIQILTARLNDGFRSDNAALLTDAALKYLINPELELSPSLETALITQNFGTPMLGILGAYLILQRRMDPPVQEIITMLAQLMNAPDCPDLQAIRAMSDTLEAPVSYSHPPMIAFGTESALRLCIERDNKNTKITPGSVFENMIQLKLNDLPVTSWFKNSTSAQTSEPWLLNAIVKNISNAQQRKIQVSKVLLSRELNVPVRLIESSIDALINDAGISKHLIAENNTILSGLKPDLSHFQKHDTMPETIAPVKIVVLFAQDTFNELQELKEHCLNILKNQELITHWDITQMLGGDNRPKTIHQKTSEADIFIGLISMAYLNDNEVMSMHKAMLESGKKFIPIIVKAGLYQFNQEIDNNNPLPRKDAAAKPLGSWIIDKNEAWQQISLEIYNIVMQMKSH